MMNMIFVLMMFLLNFFFISYIFFKNYNFLKVMMIYYYNNLIFFYLNFNLDLIMSYFILIHFYKIWFLFVFFSYLPFFYSFFLYMIPLITLYLFFMVFITMLMNISFTMSLISGDIELKMMYEIFVMELFGNLIRPIALFMRLLINLILGHFIKLIIVSFILANYWNYIFLIIFSMLVEFLVILVQLHIFLVLIMFYLGE
uniref:ATP synthase F0 subunit 6 n=1 Tax=Radopholus similis TaxID=46012 RepID=C7TQP3_RADSI|nr:ATP synthase F0 subunit 6 [Radopholus similis]